LLLLACEKKKYDMAMLIASHPSAQIDATNKVT